MNNETGLEALAKKHCISLKSWPDGEGGIEWSLMVNPYSRGHQILAHKSGSLSQTIDEAERRIELMAASSSATQ